MKTPIRSWVAVIATLIIFVALLWDRNWLAAAAMATVFAVFFLLARRNHPRR